MNKKIALTASIFATSITATNTFAAGTFETWNGADSFYRVETGLGNQTDTYGLWFTYGDDGDGGTSNIIWDMPLNPEYTEDALAPIIDECKGVCGTAHLGKGTLTYAPFVGAGFLVVGETSETDQTIAAGDASSWGGLCVTYTSDIDLQLELGLGETMDSTINYANPAVTLPAAKSADILSPNGTNGNKVVVSWSDFKQPTSYNGTVKFDGEQAAKQLVIVRFKMQADPGAYRFNICAVGPKDGTCPEKCGTSSEEMGIKIARGTNETAATKVILNGRTLGFTGIKSTATAEVLNSLGQVVARGAIEDAASTLNLSHLDAGIYMVRVVGKSTNFTNKIVLK